MSSDDLVINMTLPPAPTKANTKVPFYKKLLFKILVGSIVSIIIIFLILWATGFILTDGSYTEWQDEETCPTPHGNIVKTQVREYNPATLFGTDIPVEDQVLSQIVTTDCPVDGYYTDWVDNPFKPCPDTKLENSYSQQIRRYIKPEHGGNHAPDYPDAPLSKDNDCPVDGYYTDWIPGESCYGHPELAKTEVRTYVPPQFGGLDDSVEGPNALLSRNTGVSCPPVFKEWYMTHGNCLSSTSPYSVVQLNYDGCRQACLDDPNCMAYGSLHRNPALAGVLDCRLQRSSGPSCVEYNQHYDVYAKSFY